MVGPTAPIAVNQVHVRHRSTVVTKSLVSATDQRDESKELCPVTPVRSLYLAARNRALPDELVKWCTSDRNPEGTAKHRVAASGRL
jgi:hypothetical protein